MAMIVKSEELRNQRLQKGIAATAKADKLSQPKAKQRMLAHHDRERTPSFSRVPKLGQILGDKPLAVMPLAWRPVHCRWCVLFCYPCCCLGHEGQEQVPAQTLRFLS